VAAVDLNRSRSSGKRSGTCGNRQGIAAFSQI
jgi:hypothetical protein